MSHALRFSSRIWRSATLIKASKENYMSKFRNFSVALPNSSPYVATNQGDEHNVPLLMLPDDETSTFRRFYSINKRKVVRNVDLPTPKERSKSKPKEVRNGELSISSNNTKKWPKKKFLSSYGWLLCLRMDDYDKHSLCLLNPFTGATIKLPQIVAYDQTIPGYTLGFYIEDFRKFVLSANPTTTSDFVVAVVVDNPWLGHNQYRESFVGFLRNRDDKWLFLHNVDISQHYGYVVQDMTFYRGDFYGINNHGRIYKYQFGLNHDGVTSTVVVDMGRFKAVTAGDEDAKDYREWYDYYLVESQGSLLMMCRVARKDKGATKLFRIYEVNVENGELSEVRNLGNRAIFIGSTSSSFSVEPFHHGNSCQPNCVYYTENINHLLPKQEIVLDLGVYDLSEGKITHRKFVKSNPLTPHCWVEYPAGFGSYS